MNTYVAASVLASSGRQDWSILVLPHATPVRARPTRCVILLAEKWLSQASSQEVADEILRVIDVDHPGYEATCPGCARVFHRSKPAEVVHMCSQCRQPLEFQ